jgi:hypothetical protein
MSPTGGLHQTSRLVARPEDGAARATAQARREIPYDYVATFTLKGERSNRVQDVINISIDGAFVATAIGYSFVPGIARAIRTPPQPIPVALPSSPNPTVDWLVANLIAPVVDPVDLLRCLVVQLCGIHFTYSIIDSGTGRELQNRRIHNIAGLGESTGERPFRPLAKPMLFNPRSTIRIEIEELSEGSIYTGAELFIVLHGYKILGYGTAQP